MPDFGLTKEELRVLRTLSTPRKIQDFLNTLAPNRSPRNTCRSPRRVLALRKAHCIEGALLAAIALWLHGEEPLILDLRAKPHDFDHVIAPYKKNGYWGAISKSNHPVLRYRDPVYRTLRELVLSYFHEYVLVTTGEKTLHDYSKPINLKRIGTTWITAEKDLWQLNDLLDSVSHFPFVPKANRRGLRLADPIERQAGKMEEWKKEKKA